jgi:glycosyltransferase involved in cell wall biosynthesis
MVNPAVLHVVDSFRTGGSEGQAAQLITQLHAGGRYRLHIACINGDGISRTAIERLGVPVLRYPLTSFYDFNAATQLARLVTYARQNSISIVHAHDFYSNIFGMTAAVLAGVAIRLASRRETDGIRTRAQKRLEHLAFGASTGVITNAVAVGRHLASEGVSPRKIYTIYNGLDLARVASNSTRTEVLHKLGISDVGAIVTIVANLRLPVKDHATFLRAARRVSRTNPRTIFLIAGEGPLLEPTRALAAELGLDKVTRFLGQCDDIGELLKVSTVCVLTSRAEGFSNAILEYMGAGRPVVATDVGGAREVVVDGYTGFLVDAGDDAKLADRINTLIAEPALAQSMGIRGHETVKDRFSCSAQCAAVEDLYRTLLSSHRLARGVLHDPK